MENEIMEITISVPNGKRILSGKEVGILARGNYALDDLDKNQNHVIININAPIVTSSFILGMFSKSVKKLGLDNFFNKYEFNASPDVIENIRTNMRFSLTNKTALDG